MTLLVYTLELQLGLGRGQAARSFTSLFLLSRHRSRKSTCNTYVQDVWKPPDVNHIFFSGRKEEKKEKEFLNAQPGIHRSFFSPSLLGHVDKGPSAFFIHFSLAENRQCATFVRFVYGESQVFLHARTVLAKVDRKVWTLGII